MARLYIGKREGGTCTVTVNGKPLDPRLDILALSNTGFEWGYDGNGPGQLALAILADHLGDPAEALARYKEFRRTTIAELQDDEWTLSGAEIKNTLDYTVEVPMTLDELLRKVRGQD